MLNFIVSFSVDMFFPCSCRPQVCSIDPSRLVALRRTSTDCHRTKLSFSH